MRQLMQAFSELSGNALAALQEFYSEREETETKFEDLRASVELQALKGQLNIKFFSEDWNSSQFWYSDATSRLLAEQLLEDATSNMRIAIVCAPSVFVQLKNIIATRKEAPEVSLLEFDNRFDVFEEFVHYDFKDPLKLPSSMRAVYDRTLCDPPFLSVDCQTKVAMTIRWLSKSQVLKKNSSIQRKIVCTGATMENIIHKLYAENRTTSFEPQHTQDRLSNEFRCYANYEGSAWSWRTPRDPTAVRARDDATNIIS